MFHYFSAGRFPCCNTRGVCVCGGVLQCCRAGGGVPSTVAVLGKFHCCSAVVGVGVGVTLLRCW